MDDAMRTALDAQSDQLLAGIIDGMCRMAGQHDGKDIHHAADSMVIDVAASRPAVADLLHAVALLSLTLHRERQQGALPGGPL